MVSSFERFRLQIDEAINLIDESNKVEMLEPSHSHEMLGWVDTSSLLARCEAMCEKHEKQKPTLRIIHQFACSGGSLISKCLAALPNVFLLSELHPASKLHIGKGKPKFLPSDVTTQARYAGIPEIEDLAWLLFIENIKLVNKHVEKYSGTLIIRDHSHSDFCVGGVYPAQSNVAAHLEQDFDLIRLVTLRDPIDSYLSLVGNNWEHFEPKGFDHYCERVWAFVNEYSDNQIIRYEDFVNEPKEVLSDMAGKLNLEFREEFIDMFDMFRVTGDSGRSGNEIATRPRRELTSKQVEEFCQSDYYKKISKRFKYNDSLGAKVD